MHIYIAGPMSGYPDYNYPAFEAARSALQDRGYVAISPTDINEWFGINPGDMPWQWYMRESLLMILQRADGVALLDGWNQSVGACVERDVARSTGLPAKALSYWTGGSS